MKSKNVKLVYPIKPAYVQDWTPKEALRELIANGIDGETQFGAAFSHTYDPKKQLLELRNTKVKLPIDALFFGGSDKADDSALIGRYGEGLKLALLVLKRFNMRVSIENADEAWVTAFADLHGQRALQVTVKADEFENADFVVRVNGVSKELWADVKALFLHLGGPPELLYSSKSGDILAESHAGRVYIQGVFCTEVPSYTLGYNIKTALDSGRDRRAPSPSALSSAIGELLLAWGREPVPNSGGDSLHPDRIERIYNMLADGVSDGEALIGTGDVFIIRKYIIELWHKKHGDARPIYDEAEAAGWAEIGISTVKCHRRLATALNYFLPSLEQEREAYATQIVKTYAIEDLSQEELRAHLEVEKAMRVIGVEDDSVQYVDFRASNVFSGPSEKGVLLSRALLKNPTAQIVVWCRELSRKKVPYLSIPQAGLHDNYVIRAVQELLRFRSSQSVPSMGQNPTAQAPTS